MRAELTAAELERRLAAEFPEAFHADGGLAILDARHRGARVRLTSVGTCAAAGRYRVGSHHDDAGRRRHVCGAARLDRLGAARGHHQPQHQFPAQAGLGALTAECRLLKLGKRLAVGEVTIWAEGDEEPVAHATSTYSIPP